MFSSIGVCFLVDGVCIFVLIDGVYFVSICRMKFVQFVYQVFPELAFIR